MKAGGESQLFFRIVQLLFRFVFSAGSSGGRVPLLRLAMLPDIIPASVSPADIKLSQLASCGGCGLLTETTQVIPMIVTHRRD
jgi:hypothetical protein